MRYFPLTDSDREEMKREIGINDIRELFSDLPKGKSFFPMDNIPSAMEENDLLEKFESIAKKNRFSEFSSFLGAGAYNHFIPEVVNYLSNRGEFITPYTQFYHDQNSIHHIPHINLKLARGAYRQYSNIRQ